MPEEITVQPVPFGEPMDCTEELENDFIIDLRFGTVDENVLPADDYQNLRSQVFYL